MRTVIKHKKSPAAHVVACVTPFASVNQVYMLARTLHDILNSMPDIDLAGAKRQMYEVEDILWQATLARKEQEGEYESN